MSPATLSKMDNPQVLVSPQARTAMQGAFSRFGSKGVLLNDQMQHAIKLALAGAIHDVFVLGMIVAAVATVAALFLKEIPLRSATGAAEEAAAGQERAQRVIGGVPGAQTSTTE